jgi:integrase
MAFKIQISSNFGAVVEEFIQKKSLENKAPRTLEKYQWFARICIDFNHLPFLELTAPVILSLIRPIEARKNYETAKKLRGFIGAVIRYAIATGRASIDPTSAMKGALINVESTPRPAITDPLEFGGLLSAISSYGGEFETKAALELLALTFVRPGELRSSEWIEFDLDKAV